MRLLLISLIFFFIASCVHLIACRVKFFRKYQYPLLILLAVLGAANLALLATFQGNDFLPNTPDWWNKPLFFTPLCVYILLMFTYFVFFANATIESPTQRILKCVKIKKKASFEDLSSEVTDEHFILVRLKALEEFRLAQCTNGVYSLTKQGLKIAGLLNFYQKILGRETGG